MWSIGEEWELSKNHIEESEQSESRECSGINASPKAEQASVRNTGMVSGEGKAGSLGWRSAFTCRSWGNIQPESVACYN